MYVMDRHFPGEGVILNADGAPVLSLRGRRQLDLHRLVRVGAPLHRHEVLATGQLHDLRNRDWYEDTIHREITGAISFDKSH